MAERIRNSVIPRKKWKNDCARQQETQTVVLVTRKDSSVLGTMVVAQQISKKESLPRKKYIGILRGCSLPTETRMRLFPSRLGETWSRQRQTGPCATWGGHPVLA